MQVAHYCHQGTSKNETNLKFRFYLAFTRFYERTKVHGIGFKLGGKTQVPLLVDQQKGLTLYESEEILKYLEENY
jgi:glutathione S-transferase